MWRPPKWARVVIGTLGTISLITGWSGASVWGWYQREVLHRGVAVSSVFTSGGFRTALMVVGVLLLIALLVAIRRSPKDSVVQPGYQCELPTEVSDVSAIEYWTPRILEWAKDAKTIDDLKARSGLGNELVMTIANAAVAAGTAVPGQNEQGQFTIQAVALPEVVGAKVDIPRPSIQADAEQQGFLEYLSRQLDIGGILLDTILWEGEQFQKDWVEFLATRPDKEAAGVWLDARSHKAEDEARAWARKISKALRNRLGLSYAARFDSDAGLIPAAPPPTLTDQGYARAWQQHDLRMQRLHQMVEELTHRWNL